MVPRTKRYSFLNLKKQPLSILLYRFQTLIAQLLEHIDSGLKGTTCVQHLLNGIFCKNRVTQVEKQCFGLFSLSLISAQSAAPEHSLCKQENMIRSLRAGADAASTYRHSQPC